MPATPLPPSPPRQPTRKGSSGGRSLASKVASTRAVSFAQPTVYFKGGQVDDESTPSPSDSVTSTDSAAAAAATITRDRIVSFNTGDEVGETVRAADLRALKDLSWSFYMPDKGKSDWALDVLALPHNAIRKEICGLNILVSSLYYRRDARIAADEMDQFYSWFDEFEAFVTDYLRYEERVLYPWCKEHEVVMPRALLGKQRKATREHISALSAAIATSQWQYSQRPTEAIPALHRIAHQLAETILAYFKVQEDSLPAQMSRRAKSRLSREALVYSWIEFGRGVQNPGQFLAFSLRCMPRADDRGRFEAEWVARSTRNPLMRSMVRSRLTRTRRAFVAAHVQTANAFYSRFVADQQRRPPQQRIAIANSYA